MNKLTTLIILFLTFFAASNANAFDLESMQTPQIRDIQLVSFSAEKKAAVFNVEVYNPNDFKVPVKELSGNILINQRLVSTLEANSKTSLAPHSTQTFTVPIDVDVDMAMQAVNDVMLSGAASYTFKGYMMTPVGELPINESGQLSSDQVMIMIQTLLFSQRTN